MKKVCLSSRTRTVALVVFGLLLLVTSLHLTSTGGLAAVWDDLRNYSKRSQELVEYQQFTDELDSRFGAAAARVQFSQSLHDRLIAGNASLREVAREFTEFTRGDESFGRVLQVIVSGEDHEERAANYLLMSLARNRSLDDTISERLAAEFRSEFGGEPDFVQSAPSAISTIHEFDPPPALQKVRGIQP